MPHTRRGGVTGRKRRATVSPRRGRHARRIGLQPIPTTRKRRKPKTRIS